MFNYNVVKTPRRTRVMFSVTVAQRPILGCSIIINLINADAPCGSLVNILAHMNRPKISIISLNLGRSQNEVGAVGVLTVTRDIIHASIKAL